MGGGEMKYINEAFRENWVAPLGPNVDNFEKDLASFLGVKHAAALSSGTAAIHLALIMLGVKPGNYVIVQSFTFSATVNPIVYCGAKPVFVDSEPGSWNMDPGLLEEAIVDCIEGRRQKAEGGRESEGQRGAEAQGRKGDKERARRSSFAKASEDEGGREGESSEQRAVRNEQKSSSYRVPHTPHRIKAIIPVHLYGMPANIEKILEIANKYNIPVIEDAAEALGSKFNGKPVGTFGEIGVLSFNGNKIITTSGGGALISDNEEYIKKARFLATQARDKAPHYQHSEIGYNYRMSNIIAGIGRGQMEVIKERVKQRRENFLFYKRNLSGINGVSFIDEPGLEYFSNRWLTTILIDPKVAGITKDDVRLELEKENIETRPLWKPMHLQPVFEGYPKFVNGISEGLFERGLCLPSGSNLTEEDKGRILKCLFRIFKR
jgi:dTDP-4-amino-4,6-dideoxygalactose transaminase